MLIRFFRNEEYAKLFIQGNIFCNSLSYFQSYIEDAEGAKKTEIKCSDILEGSMQLLHDYFPFAELMGHLSCDPHITFPEYSKSHICCFCNISKANYPRNMDSFGEYCVAVYDFSRFAKHIEKAVSKIKGLYYLMGAVEYYKPAVNRKAVKQKNQALMSLEGYRVLFNNASDAFIYRDAFNKIDRFKNQLEWRLFFYKENWTTDSFTLDCDDLSDCCKLFQPGKESFFDILENNKNSIPTTRINGNIHRERLNDIIVNKNPWGKLHFSLGDFIELEKNNTSIINYITTNYIMETGEDKKAVIRLLLTENEL